MLEHHERIELYTSADVMDLGLRDDLDFMLSKCATTMMMIERWLNALDDTCLPAELPAVI